MKKIFLLYFSLFLLLLISNTHEDHFAKYFLTGFIAFQFLISLSKFLLDDKDLQEIYQAGKKIPLALSLSIDLIFIAFLFYFDFKISAFLWFFQSFLINNTFVKAEALFSKKPQNN